MKILFITNFYPPYSRGGYEQWCQEVAYYFVKKEHDIIILTSRYGKAQTSSTEPKWICRDLYLEMELASSWNWIKFFTERKQYEQHNILRIKEILETFDPDYVLVWGMWDLSWSIPAMAESYLPGKVVYYMGDYWPTLPNQQEVYWKSPGKNKVANFSKTIFRSIAIKALRQEKRPKLDFYHVLYPTEHMRISLEQKGLSAKQSTVISGAIDTSLYSAILHSDNHSGCNKPVSLLFVGRLTQEKGVETAIEALHILVNDLHYQKISLKIVGTGDPDYLARLKNITRTQKLESNVEFTGSKSKEEMPALYREADIFLFTSIWPEPFGRVIVEAMASGVTVIGTATGGAAEILIDEENSLIFEPGNAKQLAQKIHRLIESPALRRQLAEQGRMLAMEKFDIHKMASEIEKYLASI